ncbi:MAG TPA: phosphatidylserine decarboxylase family protein [Syntrophus sp. (in: bacteria)]|jgi:phosphatidylserine decarboxylase|nr:phosphatidylserine decarboxylase family protein [Syntrophus sp. (in: bacteria)]
MGKRNGIIVREGLPFILPLVLLTAVAALMGGGASALVLGAVTVFVIAFFRNPERQTPADRKLVISPADGRVIRIETVNGQELVPGTLKKVSIFMNVFNVHVNRIPYDGTVSAIRYRPGKFLSADLDKASEQNERTAVLVKTWDDREILTVQIAGIVARRIVCWLKEGMAVRAGERFGLIRFGSRLEVLLPDDATVLVRLGDKVRAGQTPIGRMP